MSRCSFDRPLKSILAFAASASSISAFGFSSVFSVRLNVPKLMSPASDMLDTFSRKLMVAFKTLSTFLAVSTVLAGNLK